MEVCFYSNHVFSNATHSGSNIKENPLTASRARSWQRGTGTMSNRRQSGPIGLYVSRLIIHIMLGGALPHKSASSSLYEANVISAPKVGILPEALIWPWMESASPSSAWRDSQILSRSQHLPSESLSDTPEPRRCRKPSQYRRSRNCRTCLC